MFYLTNDIAARFYPYSTRGSNFIDSASENDVAKKEQNSNDN